MSDVHKLGERFHYSRDYQDEGLIDWLHDMRRKHPDLWVTCDVPGKVQTHRSLDQNAYMWSMMTQIGKHLGADKGATKDFLLDECYGDRYVMVSGKSIQRRPATSKFNKKQMTGFIEWCLQWAAENAGPVMMPDEYTEWSTEHGKTSSTS